jgi:hypothetical protein
VLVVRLVLVNGVHRIGQGPRWSCVSQSVPMECTGEKGRNFPLLRYCVDAAKKSLPFPLTCFLTIPIVLRHSVRTGLPFLAVDCAVLLQNMHRPWPKCSSGGKTGALSLPQSSRLPTWEGIFGYKIYAISCRFEAVTPKLVHRYSHGM